MHRFFAFVRLSRPSFLAGGFLLYAIGVLLSLRHGADVDWAAYAAGQVAVTAAQLMTHYLNELADVETDVLNRHRTSFSGGSAVLADGVLPPRTAVLAAGVACAVSVVAAALGILWTGAWAAAAVYALMWAGAWSYSARPLSMAGSGFGELTAALVVALAVPSLGYALQTGGWSTDVLLVAAPLVALCWAMIVAFELPDFEADRA
ncbi:MAG: prenyltransferase, partial [Dehalococcoidia bacterium]